MVFSTPNPPSEYQKHLRVEGGSPRPTEPELSSLSPKNFHFTFILERNSSLPEPRMFCHNSHFGEQTCT